MVRRGSRTTAAMKHLAKQPSKFTGSVIDTPVFIEHGNELPTDVSSVAWHSTTDRVTPLISSMYEPGRYTSIDNESMYGLWYAATRPALFIVDQPGRAIK